MADNFKWIEDVIPVTLDGGKWAIDVEGMMSVEKHNIQEVLYKKGWNWRSVRRSRDTEKLKRRLCGSNVAVYYLNDSDGSKIITWSPDGINSNKAHQYVHGSVVLETYGITKPYQTKLSL